ncbi:DNA-directed RNA polymerase subunit beta, partial [Patescibacteria group bacterium]|nr:DNA-directed RNA polymerase subunit beta [Patescibacteria group bacterium]
MHISLGNDLSDFKIPDLTDIQKSSYKWFFTEGIQEILQEINPIKDTTGREWTINFSSPRLEKPELTYKQAQEKGVSYTAPWYLNLKLIKEGTRQSKEISQYMGEIPLMTPKGSFIINGVEKIVVMQLTRSYGVLFLEDLNTETGKIMPLVKVLPKYGAWLEMDITKASVLYVKIDKKRKFPVTTLLRIFGLSTDDKIRETFESVDVGEISIIEKTLEKDTTSSYNEAVLDIYKRLRPGEPEILDDAKAVIENMFFNTKRYNMGKVGRFKINQSLKFDQKTSTSLTLTPEDLINIVKKTLQLANGIGSYDVLDDLSNRRVKGVGELLQSQTRIGFVQMERNIKERMSLMPREILPEISSLVSTRPVVARIQSFFASGQLTQYPDQYNSLTALNLMRRVSVLGPGGLTKERASFSVRDVHHSQYSKVDPIHTPEGTSVGLLTYLALYAKVNEFGFLEAPYRKLIKENGKVKVSDEIVYLAAYEERNHYIAEVGMNFDKNGFISDSRIAIRKGEEFKLGLPMEADYIDVIPQQILGLTSGLIPFVANNDPTRSAMASQQITQAVPVVGAEVPLVGTGLEEAASDNARSN